MSDKIEIGYWDIRGLAAPLRMMCEFVGREYENHGYVLHLKEGGGYDISDWLKVKDTLRPLNPLINLPYVKCGDRVVTQSNACLSYLARILGLWSDDDWTLSKIEQIIAQTFDLRNSVADLMYTDPKSYAEQKGGFFDNTVPTHYDKLEKWLNLQGTKFMACDEVKVCDFPAWEMIDQIEMMAKFESRASPVANYPAMKAYYENVRQLPQLAKYFNGPMYKLPVNNKIANFQ